LAAAAVELVVGGDSYGERIAIVFESCTPQ
jgi:hypothetical protein